MSAVDFTEWAAPPLKITLGGRTYWVQPPSVGDSALLIAAAARGEVVLGFTSRPLQPEIQTLLDEMPADHHPALGPVWEQMRTDGLPQTTIDRMAYYATFYWARGKEYADTVAQLLWAPRTGDQEGGDPDVPKA